MTDEGLMKALAQVARERAEDELTCQRLEALAAGTLSGEERRALEAELAGSAEGRRALELCEPLGQRFRDRALDRLAEEASRPVRPKLLTRRSAWAGLAAAATAAAAFLLVWLPPGPARLPEYAVELRGGVQTVRGDAAVTTRFALGSRMEVILRPARAHAEEVDAWFALTRPDEVRVLGAPIERDQRGSVRMVAILGEEVSIPAGDWTLWIGYGPAGWAADGEEMLQLDAERLRAARAQVRRIPIHVQAN